MSETKPGRICPNCGRLETEPAPQICPNCGANLPLSPPTEPAPPPVIAEPQPAQNPWALTPTVPMSQRQRQRSSAKASGWILGCFLFFGALVLLGFLAICGIIPTP